MSSQTKNRRIAMAALLAALALIFSYVEAMIPSPVAIPGVKLGVANIVVVVGLYIIKAREVFVISVIRIILVGILFGNASELILSCI